MNAGARRRSYLALAMLVAVALGIVGARAFDADHDRAIRPRTTYQGAPAPPGALRFVVIGDFGKGNSTESDVAGAIRSFDQGNPLDGFVTTGDDVYDSGDPSRFDAAWREPFGWVQDEGIPVVAALGNHDVETAGGQPVMDLLGMPARWYTRTFGSVQFVVLDANEPANTEQLTFLRETLSASTTRWTVVVFHQPAFSCGPHGSTPGVDQAWVPLFRQYRVDLVVNGHDHNYQRFPTIDGVTYVVSGGGGAELYTEIDDCNEGTPKPLAAQPVHHFLVMTVWPAGLRVEALGTDLRSIDVVTLR